MVDKRFLLVYPGNKGEEGKMARFGGKMAKRGAFHMMIAAAMMASSPAAWADFSFTGLPQTNAGPMAVQGQAAAPAYPAAPGAPVGAYRHSAYRFTTPMTNGQPHLQRTNFEQTVETVPPSPSGTPFSGYAPVPQPQEKAPKAPDLKGYIKAVTKVPTLAQKGSGYAIPCHGGGTVPMNQAIYQIMPEGWTMYAKPGLVMNVPVTYACKGRPWTQVMTGILKSNGYAGAVWWGYNVLTLKSHPVSMPDVVGLSNQAPAAPVPVSAPAPTVPVVPSPASNEPAASGQQTEPLATSGNDTTMGTAQQAVFNAPLTPVFTMDKGETVLGSLQKWANTAGWTVIWNLSENWQVPNAASFSGDFQKAVSQVIQALAANGAPIHAVFHTANNTVVINGAGGGE